MKKIAILCDFDGTVATDDVGNKLFQTFSDPSKTGPIVDRWMAGHIDSRECLEQEAALSRASHDELQHFICRCVLDPYFKDFVDFTRRRGMEVVIVSDGLDYYIERMLMRSGLADLEFFANRLTIDDRTLKIAFPHYNMLECRECGNCKTFHLERYRQRGYYIVYVGNGLSDRCPCQQSDLVFAKGELLDFCRANDVNCVEFRNFRDVEREILRRFVLSDAQSRRRGIG